LGAADFTFEELGILVGDVSALIRDSWGESTPVVLDVDAVGLEDREVVESPSGTERRRQDLAITKGGITKRMKK
jgi:hypothetical protein